jgi:ectoine hydroxylase-related dioxygenase (phytanoyl-CoA dioxygenase family)
MSALPDDRGAWVCNSVWMLDDFTEQNGALRVVPGSHRSNRLPQDALDDATADHPRQRLVTGAAGSVIVMNAHLWHGGMANRTASTRTAVHVIYCRRDKPQQQYQKELLDQELQAILSPELRHLLAIDDHLNDELAGQRFKRSGFIA